jgi:hypothetical protein
MDILDYQNLAESLKLSSMQANEYYQELLESISAYCKKDGIVLRNYKYNKEDENSFLKMENKNFNYYIEEINETIFVQIDVYYFRYKNKIYTLGFQYQAGTSKINCRSPGYMLDNSSSYEIDFIEDIFLKKELFKNYSKLNKPRTRANISRSHRLLSRDNKSVDDFASEFYIEFKNALSIINTLKTKIKLSISEIKFLEIE